MNAEVLLLLLGGVAVLGFLMWTHMQQKAKLLQTLTVEFAGGLRFEAHLFSVEMQNSAKRVKISAQQGIMKVTPLHGTEQKHDGTLGLYLPAAGLTVAMTRTPVPTGASAAAQTENTFEIVFSATDGLSAEPSAAAIAYASVVRLQGLPEPVVRSFQVFANRLSIWADKITKFAEQDKAQAQANEAAQDAATAALEAQAKEEAAKAAATKEAASSLDLAGQIALWRKTAGFSGQHSEVGTQDKGGIDWFIDLDPKGRITLYGNKRAVFTTLEGCSIKVLPKAIEIGVRDEYWSQGDPLLVFQVLQGRPPDERRNWKDLLESARDRLEISLRKGY